ncbi:Ribosomal RNA small subunit methyltransferase B [Acidisarcina polymorpha]|uniref:Ribosomal RNA small subunit methyltransferase B n=1 Tax=Acidisarcina polymorpha TaxID=2211140 RepID=A0A2Z5FXN9_9BACT|nr:transcription antitermination factor NusB [Acidisarcina polymorpha]AXC11500.1 Ribosomal RNA small subunit methyltransferase B [Acidisarcina polymorpha]
MIAPARSAAFEILLQIQRDAGHCDELLRSAKVDRLSQPDRNLCTSLVMGTLRWQIALDQRVDAMLARPDARLEDEVRIALRLGAFQMLYLDRIPSHAAVMDSVELVKSSGHGFASGMVNAILRKIAVEPPVELPATFTTASELAAAYAHPAWMVERWVLRYGIDRAAAICKFDQAQPPITIRLINGEAEAALTAENIELAPGAFLKHARTVVRGDVTATAAYRDGSVRIQDEGSQLVAELAGHGQTILDTCAAPGGKTAILAERNPKATLLACDVSRRRLDEMRGLLRNARGARISYETVDAAKLAYERHFDLVLCDVPCSGTGTIARNPEIRHRLEPAEFARQHSRQVAILLAAMRALQPGGRLLYASCSLEPEENEAVIQDCLSGRSEYRETDLREQLDTLAATGNLLTESAAGLLEKGRLRTIPGVHPCDGFFAAMLERTA